MSWNAPVSDQEAARRAGGRRRFNAKRKGLAKQRRRKLAVLILKSNFQTGWQRKLAGALKISESTISRDLMTPRLQPVVEKRLRHREEEDERRFVKEMFRLKICLPQKESIRQEASSV